MTEIATDVHATILLIWKIIYISAFFEKTEVKAEPEKPKHLIIAMSSDKGLCGAIHAGIGRAIRYAIPEKPPGTDVKIICVGDKQRAALARLVLSSYLCRFHVCVRPR